MIDDPDASTVRELPQDATPETTTLQLAEPGARIAAWLIDVAFLGTCMILVQPLLMIFYLMGVDVSDATGAQARNLTLGVTLAAVPAVLHLVYFIAFTACSRGATPGKMLLGIAVVNKDGRLLTWRQSACRAGAAILTALTCGIGYLVLALDPRRRALHDHLCATRVVSAASVAGAVIAPPTRPSPPSQAKARTTARAVEWRVRLGAKGRAMAARILVYLVVTVFAFAAFAPNGIEILRLVSTGEISAGDMVAASTDALKNLWKQPDEAPERKLPPIFGVKDLGNGLFAMSERSSERNSTQLLEAMKLEAMHSCGLTRDLPISAVLRDENPAEVYLEFYCSEPPAGAVFTAARGKELRRLWLQLPTVRARMSEAVMKQDSRYRTEATHVERQLNSREEDIRRASDVLGQLGAIRELVSDYEAAAAKYTALIPVTPRPTCRVMIAYGSPQYDRPGEIRFMEDINRFLAVQERRVGRTIERKRVYGWEWGFTIWLPLTELNAAQQERFVRDLRIMIESRYRAARKTGHLTLTENPFCPEEDPL